MKSWMLSVRNLIDSLSAFVILNSLTDDRNDIQPFFDPIDVKLRIGAVATIDADGLQAEELFKDVPALAEVHDTVELDIVTASVEHSLLNDELL